MKEKLIKHLDLKILALLFAVILWLIVVNIDDPVKTVQFSGINVQILHASDLEKQGYCYDVIDGTDTINVSVTGRRSVIEEISKGNDKKVLRDHIEALECENRTLRHSNEMMETELDKMRASDNEFARENRELRDEVFCLRNRGFWARVFNR